MGSLNNPPVVDVFERVTGDLLLMRTAPIVRVSDGVEGLMGVHPTGPAVSMP